MTDTTNIVALREAALKATKGEWRAFTNIRTGTCAVHTPEDKGCGNIIDWPGFDSAAGSKKQKVANAKYIALANPVTILELLDQLEAERQRADDAIQLNPLALDVSELEATYIGDIRIHMAAISEWKQRAEAAEAEIAALKGDQVPFAYSYNYAGCETCEGFRDWRKELSSERPPEWMLETGKVTELVELFTAPQKPVMLPEGTGRTLCGDKS